MSGTNLSHPPPVQWFVVANPNDESLKPFAGEQVMLYANTATGDGKLVCVFAIKPWRERNNKDFTPVRLKDYHNISDFCHEGQKELTLETTRAVALRKLREALTPDEIKSLGYDDAEHIPT